MNSAKPLTREDFAAAYRPKATPERVTYSHEKAHDAFMAMEDSLFRRKYFGQLGMKPSTEHLETRNGTAIGDDRAFVLTYEEADLLIFVLDELGTRADAVLKAWQSAHEAGRIVHPS